MIMPLKRRRTKQKMTNKNLEQKTEKETRKGIPWAVSLVGLLLGMMIAKMGCGPLDLYHKLENKSYPSLETKEIYYQNKNYNAGFLAYSSNKSGVKIK